MMQLTSDDLVTAVAGQWLGARPWRVIAAHKEGQPPIHAPLMLCGVGTDTREDLTGRLFIALRGERFDAHHFLASAQAQGAAAALVDRRGTLQSEGSTSFVRPQGLPLIEVADTRTAIADLARYWRSRLRGKVVAVTGSSGKTTTRQLIHAALGTRLKGSASPKSFNNDIGVPLTLLAAGAADDYVVAEIGMSHPGEIAPLSRIAAPHVVVITMAGRAHIGGMGSMEAIIQEKASIVDGLNTNGMVVVNGDQPDLVAAVMARVKPGVRVVTFGTAAHGQPSQWKLLGRTATGSGQTMQVGEPDGTQWECPLSLPGDYNAMNALAAVAVARAIGMTAEEIGRAFGSMESGSMRMSRQVIGHYVIYNDAYNANPDAVLAALRAFGEVAAGAKRRVVILGDMLELGGQDAIEALHAEVGRAVAAHAPALAVFVGPGSEHGARAARESGHASGCQVIHLPQLDESGVATVAAALKPGDAVLLKGSRGSRMERMTSALEARELRNPACSTT